MGNKETKEKNLDSRLIHVFHTQQAGKARVFNSNVLWVLFGETLSLVESCQQLHLDIERKNSIQKCIAMRGQTYLTVIRRLHMGHW